MIKRAFEVAEGNVGVYTEAFNLMEDRRVGGVGGVIAMHLAGNHDAHRRWLRLHRAHLNRRSMSAHQQAVALRPALLPSHNQRILRIPRRMTGRKVHTLEVIVVGFYLRPHADRVAQRRVRPILAMQ